MAAKFVLVALAVIGSFGALNAAVVASLLPTGSVYSLAEVEKKAAVVTDTIKAVEQITNDRLAKQQQQIRDDLAATTSQLKANLKEHVAIATEKALDVTECNADATISVLADEVLPSIAEECINANQEIFNKAVEPLAGLKAEVDELLKNGNELYVECNGKASCLHTLVVDYLRSVDIISMNTILKSRTILRTLNNNTEGLKPLVSCYQTDSAYRSARYSANRSLDCIIAKYSA